MAATQKQIDANRANALRSTGPKSAEGKHRASLNAWRHGLTGQVVTLPDEDRDAFRKFTREIRLAFQPEGSLETQIAQSIAEDEWRLNRARAIENNILALGHATQDANVNAANTQIHAALTQARTFWRSPEKFALLTLYEQRISRKIQRNEQRLHTLQENRKAALRQLLEEAELLARQAEADGQTYDPAPDLPAQVGFAFSPEQFRNLLHRHRRLKAARRLSHLPEIPVRNTSPRVSTR